MLKRLRLHNFKTFLNFEIDLTRLHLVIGKNNSGKSNLCYALRFLGATALTDYDKAGIPGGLDGFCHRGHKSRLAEFECTCELPFQGQSLTFEYKLHVEVSSASSAPTGSQPPIQTRLEELVVSGPDYSKVILIKSDGISVKLANDKIPPGLTGELPSTKTPDGCSMLSKLFEDNTNPRAILFRRFLGSINYYALSAPLMRYGWNMPSEGPAVPLGMGLHGLHLPFALFHLKNEDEPGYRKVLEYVAMLEPDFDSVNFFVAPDNKPTPYIILKSGHRVSWDSLSDGMLYVFGLATIVAEASRYRNLEGWPTPLAIIEEPENGLYCGFLREIWEHLTTQAWQSQFITTSQNPYFIDLFDRDLENVSYLRKDGQVTTCTPLTKKRAIIEKHRGDFSLGELHFKEVFE